jgi:hypothetical protein
MQFSRVFQGKKDSTSIQSHLKLALDCFGPSDEGFFMTDVMGIIDRRSMTPGISSRLSSPPPAAHPSPPPAAAPSAAATPSHPPSPTPDAFTRLEEKWDQFVVMFHRYKEKTEKELQAAVRL